MPQRVKVTTEDGQSVILTLDDDAPEPSQGGQGGGALGLTAIGSGIPLAARAATAFAQSPTAAKTSGAIARGLTTLGALGHGAYTGSLSQILAAPMEGWAAGKGGYWLGKGAQSLTKPIASGLQRIAPYAQSLNTLGAASGVGELAQMAEPQRKDIGFLGIGPSQNVPGQQPALLNLLLQKIRGGQ